MRNSYKLTQLRPVITRPKSTKSLTANISFSFRELALVPTESRIMSSCICTSPALRNGSASTTILRNGSRHIEIMKKTQIDSVPTRDDTEDRHRSGVGNTILPHSISGSPHTVATLLVPGGAPRTPAKKNITGAVML